MVVYGRVEGQVGSIEKGQLDAHIHHLDCGDGL